MDKMRMESVDITAKNIEKIERLFPNCVTESVNADGKLRKAINFDILRQILSSDVIDGDEAYEFTWVGKKAAIVEANRPIRKTLRPYPEESMNWDATENLYIEGDNLEVLKLLQESYLEQVKMIYIDPPYNTGHDFVYPDSFIMDNEDYNEGTGYFDEDGNINFARENGSVAGKYHSDWCSMIYSRLMLARNLLREDGVIFISIDDNEYENLKKMADEIFGRDNVLATLVWDLGTGTTAGHFTRGHEYILCYCKKKSTLPNFRNVNEGEKIAHGALKKISYKNPPVEITFPAGFEYDGKDAVFTGEIGDSEKEYILSDEMRFKDGKLVSPVTLKAGFAMRNQVEDFIAGKEVFDTKGQRLIRFYFNSKGILFYEKEKSVVNPRTVLSNIANTKNGTTELANIFDGKVFDFPKPTQLLKYLIQLVVDDDSIVMDFFSGSASTADAVMSLNSEDGGRRKFIMVQIPEPCSHDSEAYKAGYKNICEVGKERIRRVGKKLQSKTDGDFGFRVLKLDDTNMRDVYYSAEEYDQQMLTGLESNIKNDRTDLDLLFGCLLEWGIKLSLPYSSETIDGCTVHTYNDGDLIACFDENISNTVVENIAKRKPLRAVFCDSSFPSSPAKINVDEIFKLIAPDTRVKVI